MSATLAGEPRRYRHQIVVADEDIDALGHVSNVTYLRWVQEVAKAASTDAGWGFERYLELGAVFVVRRHEIDYLKPAFAGQTLALVTWVESWSAATSIRCTRIHRAEDGVELARAATTWALVSTETGRLRRIPKELPTAFAVDDVTDPSPTGRPGLTCE